MSAPRGGKVQLALVAVVLLLALGGGAKLYMDRQLRPEAAPETITLGQVQDVLELDTEVGAAELAGGLPATLHVGAAQDVDALLAARRGSTATTLIDVSGLDAIGREALSTRLVEAALEDGGAIAVDASGVTVRALQGPLAGAVRVELDAASVLVARAPLGAASPAAAGGGTGG